MLHLCYCQQQRTTILNNNDMQLTNEQTKTLDQIIPYINEAIQKGMSIDDATKYAFEKSIKMLDFLSSEEGKGAREHMADNFFKKANS